MLRGEGDVVGRRAENTATTDRTTEPDRGAAPSDWLPAA